MVIEMVARQIGEGACRQANTIKAALIEPVRRCLEREVADRFVYKLIERFMQRDRIGRRQRTVDFARWRDEADRAERSGTMAERDPDLPRESRDRTFAARASDRDNRFRLARIETCRG